MELLPHILLLALAAFAAYGHLTERHSHSLSVLVIILPTFGVYWLGAWALLTYLIGYFVGGSVFLSRRMKD
jgi:hypothetical protein